VILTHDSENSNLQFSLFVKFLGPGIIEVTVAPAAKTVALHDRRREALVQASRGPDVGSTAETR
jgi:hypothetical protein